MPFGTECIIEGIGVIEVVVQEGPEEGLLVLKGLGVCGHGFSWGW